MGETTQLEDAKSGQQKLLGLTVDTTARVMGLAQPRQILLTRHLEQLYPLIGAQNRLCVVCELRRT